MLSEDESRRPNYFTFALIRLCPAHSSSRFKAGRLERACGLKRNRTYGDPSVRPEISVKYQMTRIFFFFFIQLLFIVLILITKIVIIIITITIHDNDIDSETDSDNNNNNKL